MSIWTGSGGWTFGPPDCRGVPQGQTSLEAPKTRPTVLPKRTRSMDRCTTIGANLPTSAHARFVRGGLGRPGPTESCRQVIMFAAVILCFVTGRFGHCVLPMATRKS